MTTAQDAHGLAAALAEQDVVGVTVGWIDNNGIVRSRTVPTAKLAATAERGVGITAAFAVFDSHDGITFTHEGLSNPSGDVRLVPVLDKLTPLAGQPGLAWAPGRQVGSDGSPWPYCQRTALQRQVDAAAEERLTFLAGYEVEFVVSHEGDDFAPAHRGPAYGPNGLRDVDEFTRQLLTDLAANGLEIDQLHAEYGQAQIEIALAATDPLSAADNQLLARQTIHSAARAHGLRVSFAPVVDAAGAGSGWHLHTSAWRDEVNLLAGDGAHALSPDGEGYVAGMLRELAGIAAVTGPSEGSLLRRRPGYWAGAYGFWGVQNREAALRYIPATSLLGAGSANVELKPSDASANPYLSLAVVIAAGRAGIRERLTLPEPVADDVGGWSDERRAAAGIAPLLTDSAEQIAALKASRCVREALGEDLLGAFIAVREADAAWASGKTLDEVVDSHRWLY